MSITDDDTEDLQMVMRRI